MKRLIEAVAKKIPRELKNYHLIKRQEIYIPYREIGIVCLTKEVAEINLFFETILKLIDIEISDVYEMSTIMGIDFKLLKETIVDMIEQRYIVTSENKLVMTPKGKKALVDRKSITIRKKNINQILVNMITGDVEESGKSMESKLSKNNICLSEEQVITKDFLESRYVEVNDIYQKNQIEANIFNTKLLQRELYKILGISYDKLYFLKEEILIYKHDDSADYEFVISGDIGERYLECFYRQVRDVVYSGMENFFERDWNFAQRHYNSSIVSKEERGYTRNLLKELYGREMILGDDLDKYLQSRELIDNTEIETLFSYNTEIDYEGIIISCDRMRKLLNPSIVSVINQISKKKIWLLYNKDEYDIDNFLERQLGGKKNDISLLERLDTESQFICFYPNILIEFVEKTEEIFKRPLTVLEGRIEFNSDVIKQKMNKVIISNNISFLMTEIKEKEKSEQKEQNKGYNKKRRQVVEKYKRTK